MAISNSTNPATKAEKSPKAQFQGQVWLGDDTVFDVYLQQEQFAKEQIQLQQIKMASDDDEDDDAKKGGHLYQEVGDLAVISVRGALKNYAAWYDKYFAIPSYEAIRQAAYQAMSDDNIKRVLFIMDTPGGMASGITSAIDTLYLLADKKPTVTYTPGTLASAGYWLGAATGTIIGDRLSSIGSIGAVMTHIEVSEMLEKAGVKATVIRSGKFKHMPSMYEELSEAGLQVCQEQIMALAKEFKTDVARLRGFSMEYLEQGPGQGQVFIGSAAVEHRLADQIMTFPTLTKELALGKFDNGKISVENNGYKFTHTDQGTTMALTPEQLALLAQAQATAAQASPAATEAPATPALAAGELPDPAPEAAALMAKDETIAKLTAELSTANAEKEAAQALNAQMRGVVETAIASMRVGLNQSERSFAHLDVSQLMTEHELTSKEFASLYKVGGVSATPAAIASDPDTQKVKSNPSAPPVSMAAVHRTRLA